MIKSLTPHCQAGGFPSDAWDPTLRGDIPLAIEFVETNASELTLPPPPPDDSKETYSEIDYLKRIASKRNSKDIVLIAKENHKPQRRFHDLLDITKADHPRTFALIERITSEAYQPILYFKHKFSRTRPYHLDHSLNTVIDGPPHASYPSGHATQAYLLALTLSKLLHEDDPRIDKLMTLGTEMGVRREIAGVHYPSDTQAGISLAKQLNTWLMEKPDFIEAFNAAKAELASNDTLHSTAH